MDERKALVVCYSRTGVTAKLAAAIAQALGCTVEMLADLKDRSGVRGYAVAVKDALTKKLTEIEPIAHDPAGYDLILIGTPVWAGTMACAVRAYLTQTAQKLPDVAFFLTTGGSGIPKTFRTMSELAGKAPRATLGLRTKQVRHGAPPEEVAAFVAELTACAES
jgi:flavodoxin